MKRLLIVMAVAALAAGAVSPAAAAQPSGESLSKSDNLSSPLADKQSALKQNAMEQVLAGKATPSGKNKVVKLAPGQFVELAQTGEDQILSVLGEFGTGINAVTGGTPGPLHNQIPQPDRTVNNVDIWTADFNKSYYENLLYNKNQVPSMANWYLQQSNGTYSVNGMVGDWVTVPFNEARYGTNLCGSIVCSTVWIFVNSSSDLWWNNLVTATGSVAAANAALAPFDVWDRYDYDSDGNFDEPDGYIDHFQSIHAGMGEETGGGAQGTNAIWSHRWYAYQSGTGPDGSGPHGFGGVKIGASNYWIGDYTIEPENGGVGVFAHEFGHDLGLPDEYDTSGNTGGAENGTAWWTNWSQGSYGTLDQNGLGTYPVAMTAWEKFQLGFLYSYEVGFTGQKNTFLLGPVEYATKKPQAIFVVLPDKQKDVNIGTAFAGSNFYHSGAGNDLDNNMTRPITLGAGPISLSLQARYQTETCWDYWYVEVSTDGGTTFNSIPTDHSDAANENGQNFGNGITGTSGSPKVCDALGSPTWVPVTANLSAYANSTIQLRFRYWTDGAVIGTGVSLDDIAITGLATDGAETDPGWAYAGFSRTTGTITTFHFNAYVVESRTYLGYDEALQKGPYNFTSGTFVEHFPYQDGMLVWYWDTSFEDNNVGDHPGGGLILPVDSHPAVLHWNDAAGSTARPRIQSYDASFTLGPTDAITLHNGPSSSTLTSPSQPGVAKFNDNNSYWVNGDPGDAAGNTRYQSEWNSVNVPHTGTTIQLKSMSSTGIMTVDINK